MDAEPVEPGLTSWLAAQGDVDREQVAAELEVGARRRSFVVDELAEAGFEGAELLALTMGLTGLDTTDAQALIGARTGSGARESDVPKRDRRLAQNEILFRRINERLAGGYGDSLPPALELVCECSDRECLSVLTIATAEYEWLQAEPAPFRSPPGTRGAGGGGRRRAARAVRRRREARRDPRAGRSRRSPHLARPGTWREAEPGGAPQRSPGTSERACYFVRQMSTYGFVPSARFA